MNREKRQWVPEVLRAVAVTAALGLLVFILIGGSAPLDKGRPAPPTRGMTLDGGAFDLQQWRGQYVFVNIWATWCAPCVNELPDLALAATKWPEVRFVGLAAASPRQTVELMTSRFGLPYPVVPIDNEQQVAWNANALPSSYLVAPDGTIAWSAVGALDPARLAKVLQTTAVAVATTAAANQSATTSP